MEIIYLLVPLAAVLAVAIAWGLLWAIRTGQFDDLDRPGPELLWDEPTPANPDDVARTPAPLASTPSALVPIVATIAVAKPKHPGCANACSDCPDAN